MITKICDVCIHGIDFEIFQTPKGFTQATAMYKGVKIMHGATVGYVDVYRNLLKQEVEILISGKGEDFEALISGFKDEDKIKLRQ